MEYSLLLAKAIEARTKAYAPYSGFAVGAALLASDGQVFTGCNIENASYGLSVCAEQVAIFKAISLGLRDFTTLAVVADVDKVVTPCGACRQILTEFGDLKIIMANLRNNIEIKRVSELLPMSFSMQE